jgi:two-component system, OmpR family, phosphate regulon sensor histidine kinase PhoR
MFRLSSKKVVILAAVCFLGLVILQVVWMDSVYKGEIALYEKARKQFESELQTYLNKDEQVKAGLKKIINSYDQKHQLDRAQIDWFHYNFVPAIIPMELQLGIYLEGISIVRNKLEDSLRLRSTTVVSNIYESPASSQVEKAGKICIDCIPGLRNDLHDRNGYQLLLFYRNHRVIILENLAILMFCSLVLLIILGLLFRQIMTKYKQERKLSEAKNDFINNLSHEMQTPVFAIQMANKLIIEKMAEVADIKPLTQIIEKEAKQLKHHAAKILELASLENDQIELSKELTELNAFIEQKQQTVELMMKDKGGELTLRFGAKHLYSKIDPVHFNNVLISIADNAIKYNEGAPQFLIETGEADSMVYLKFTDNGIGIKKEYLPSITEKFFRVPDVKRSGIAGFGLGLNYVKHIVDLHEGEIKFASEEGKGTTITILLPKATAYA